MCNPAIALAAVGTGITAYGQYQQGKAAQAEANYRAAIQRNNAIRAGYLAKDARERGLEAQRKQGLQGRLLLGKARTALAANGVLIDASDTSGDLLVDQAAQNTLDVAVVGNNAEREAQGYLIRAQNFESEASLTEFAGANARRNANIKALGTLVGGAGDVSSKWYSLDREGAFGP